MAMIPIPKEFADMFHDIGEHLKYRDRFRLPEDLEKVVDDLARIYSNNSKTIKKGTTFWRARINGVDQDEAFDKSDMGAPPRGAATSGRINPLGISYLYGAFTEKTAISEVRPWKGAVISVGKFTTTEKINATDLSQIGAKIKGDTSKGAVNEFAQLLIYGIVVAKYFSVPAHESDQLAYLPSQYISERIKEMGVQAILYPSVLDSSGENIAFFSPRKTVCESVKTVTVNGVTYEFKDNA